jgi:alpha-beta hydrolase superfamily lysophospholipase
MLHGLESHAGWFVRSARHLAAHGFPVHAFDRCGSGVSRADATLGSDLEVLLAEIDTVGEAALAGTSHDRFTLVGHCFGALLALLYAGRHRPERVASLVLATPALHTRTDVPRRDKLRIVADVLRRGHARVPLPLEPEQFSELPAFVEMVRADPLALRSVPARLLFEVWRARFDLPKAAEALHAPLFVGMAQKDVICDNARNLRLLAHVTAPTAIVVYSGARHILELSAQSEAFLNDLATWLQRQEAS